MDWNNIQLRGTSLSMGDVWVCKLVFKVGFRPFNWNNCLLSGVERLFNKRLWSNDNSCFVKLRFLSVVIFETGFKGWMIWTCLLSLWTFDFLTGWALSDIIGNWSRWNWWSLLLEDVEALLDLRGVLDKFLIIILELLTILLDW